MYTNKKENITKLWFKLYHIREKLTNNKTCVDEGLRLLFNFGVNTNLIEKIASDSVNNFSFQSRLLQYVEEEMEYISSISLSVVT